MKFGLYHSLYEWYNPLWLFDKKHNFTTNLFTAQKVNPELKELVLTYKPEILWSDGDWEATEDYWKSKEFLVWLYNDSPVKETIVVNDRWGKNTNCHHGDFYTCTDRYNPGKPERYIIILCFKLAFRLMKLILFRSIDTSQMGKLSEFG